MLKKRILIKHFHYFGISFIRQEQINWFVVFVMHQEVQSYKGLHGHNI